MIDSTAVIVAAVAGLPATIAAIAAIRSRRESKATRKEVSTENGMTSGQTMDHIGQTLEVVQAQGHTNAKEILGVHEKVDRIEQKVDRIDGRVERVDAKTDRFGEQLADHVEEMKVRVMEHDAMVQRLKKEEEEA